MTMGRSLVPFQQCLTLGLMSRALTRRPSMCINLINTVTFPLRQSSRAILDVMTRTLQAVNLQFLELPQSRRVRHASVGAPIPTKITSADDQLCCIQLQGAGWCIRLGFNEKLLCLRVDKMYHTWRDTEPRNGSVQSMSSGTLGRWFLFYTSVAAGEVNRQPENNRPKSCAVILVLVSFTITTTA